MMNMGFIKAMDTLPTLFDHCFKSDDAIKVAQVVTTIIHMIQIKFKNTAVQPLMELQ